MKYKITRKLVLYFTAVLFLFSLIVGGSFLALFTEHTEQIYRAEMEKKAVAIATGVSGYFESETAEMDSGIAEVKIPQEYANGNKQSGQTAQATGKNDANRYNAYINAIADIALGEVWIVDQSAETISVGTGKKEITYSELPAEGIALVQEVFQGEVAFSQGFSSLLGNASLTVGAPVLSEEGEVIAAVLMHTYVENMEEAIRSGLYTLGVSLTGALVAAIAIAILLAMKFIKPLRKMEQTTQQLANNDYHARTGILQNDEMGSLAANIDILADRLKEASKESEKLDKMRKEFITGISHELRTPVTVIRGSLEALADHVVTDPKKVDEYHQQMLTESIHLERMINDLLELSRLQNPDYQMRIEELNFVDVIENAIRSIGYIAKEKGIILSFTKDLTYFSVIGDYSRLRQMLLAVLENAVKFSPEKNEILASLDKIDNGCRLTITDHGPGIAKNDQPHIFEKFFKSNDESNKKGTGLGLAVAKQIADRHHIGLTVESERDQGATFIFTLLDQKK